MKDLVNELLPVTHEWKHLGVQLNMQVPCLNSIAIKCNNDPNLCLLEMLSQWLDITFPPPTWQTVVDALSSPALNRQGLAQKIKLKYCEGSTETQVELLEREFNKLKRDACTAFLSEPVDRFKLGLTSISNGEIHMGFWKEIIHKDTIADIMFGLNYYLNFLNYSIMEHILSNFGNEHLHIKLKEYSDKVGIFLKTTLVHNFIACWPKHKCQPPTELCFIVLKTTKNWETCTLADLEHLRGTLAHKLFLPDFTLVFDTASCEGCLTVTYSTSSSLITQLQTTIKGNEVSKVFSNLEIETITVDGVLCYDSNFRKYIEDNPLMSTPVSSSSGRTLSMEGTAEIFSISEVMSEMESLENEFMQLKDNVCESLLTQPVDIFKFRLTSLKIGEVEHHMYYLKEIICSKQTVVEILVELNDGYFNYMNYGLLQHVLEKFENRHLQIRMNEFKVKIVHFFKHTQVCDFIHCWLGNRCKPQLVQELQHFIELKTTNNWKTCTLQDLEDLKDRLATKLFLPNFPFILKKASEGCLAVTFSVPSSFVARLQTDIKMKDFRDMDIELIAVDGVVCYTTPMPYQHATVYTPVSNPMIHAAMYTPLSAAIVEQVFKSAPHNPPTTVTGLYSSYVLMRLEQHLSEHPEYSDMNIKVKTLADLPERVLGDLQQLCRLAYEGVSQQMIVFSSLPEGVSSLGLLQTVPQVYDKGEDRVSYNFLHYTVQEYLAALHLSHLQPKQLMTIIDTKWLRMVKTIFGREYYEATQLKTTFQFLAGITKLEPFPVDFLSDLLEKDEATIHRWLYESQNQSLLISVLGSGRRGLSLSYSTTTTDYFAAGYCLAHSNCRWNLNFISVNDVSMESLSKGYHHQIPETDISSQLVSASFSNGSITTEGVRHFLTIPNLLLQHIQYLDLSVNELDKRGCELLAEGLQRMPCLEKLVLIRNSGIGCGGAVQLVSSLHSSKLRGLYMTRTGISDPDFECLASYIHSTTSLEDLWIGEKNISVESFDSLCKNLSDNNSMRRLNLWSSHLTTSHCVCLGQLLKHPIHCQIEKLYLRDCSLTSDGVGEVMSGLSHNHTLWQLKLNDNQIGSEGAVAIATMLKINRSLERLDLEKCGIGSSGGVELGAALERNKTLRYLNLSGNALGDDGVRGLCVGLENNSSLEELWLNGDESLGEEGVSLLLKCLEEKNTSLKRLWLPGKFKRDVSSELESRLVF